MLVESFKQEENWHTYKRFCDFIPISPPVLEEFNLTVYSYFVPRQNIINPEQNGVSNGCQTCCDDVAFHLKEGVFSGFRLVKCKFD